MAAIIICRCWRICPQTCGMAALTRASKIFAATNLEMKYPAPANTRIIAMTASVSRGPMRRLKRCLSEVINNLVHRIIFLPADGFAQQLGGIGELEFFLDVRAMGLDGFHAHIHHLGDLARLVTLAQQLKRFKFAVAQL